MKLMSKTSLRWKLIVTLCAPQATLVYLAIANSSIVAAVAALVAIPLAIMLVRGLSNDLRRIRDIAGSFGVPDVVNDAFEASSIESATALADLLQARDLLTQQIAIDRQQAVEGERLKQALDKVSANVMLADTDLNIIYLNDTVKDMFQRVESDLRQDLPNFSVDKLLGTNIDDFHKNPAHQRGLLKDLTTTFNGTVEVGGRTFSIVANPVFDNTGVRLGTVIEWQNRTLELSIKAELTAMVAAAKAGDLSARIDLGHKTGFFEIMSRSVNELVEVAETVVGDSVRVFGALAEGRLTETMDNDFGGVFAQLRDDANRTVAKMNEVVTSIGASANSVSINAGELTQGNANLSQRTEEQASSLEETASAMEEMTGTTTQNADNARQANQLAVQAREQAEEGGKVVRSAVGAMNAINASSKKISDIIGVIDEIAFQTNLLALNASVEAARAGEQGRGFAVVATEVRNLAGRSATAAKEIKELIVDSARKVEEGSRLVNESGETLEEIVSAVKKVTDIVAEIAAASQEQSTGIEQVNKAILQMDDMTQQNAALVEEAAAASSSMSDQAAKLTQMIGFFTTADGAATDDAFASIEVDTDPDPEFDRRSEARPWRGDNAATQDSAPSEQPHQVAAAGGASDSDWEEF